MKGVAMSADLVESGAISGKMLKELYDLAFERGEDFPAIYEKEKPQQLTDTAAIEKIIDEVIAANPRQLEQYRAGKKTVIGFFVGQVMKASKGQANPALVNELLAKKLDGSNRRLLEDQVNLPASSDGSYPRIDREICYPVSFHETAALLPGRKFAC